MEIKIYWDNGDIETWKPTFMNYSEGVLLENDRLIVESAIEPGLETRHVKSISYHRKAYLAGDGKLRKEVLLPILTEETVGNVLTMEVDGIVKFEHDGFGGLVDLAWVKEVEGETLEVVAPPEGEFVVEGDKLDTQFADLDSMIGDHAANVVGSAAFIPEDNLMELAADGLEDEDDWEDDDYEYV